MPRIEAAWPALTGSLLMRIQLIRAEAHELRARAAIASLTGAPSRGVTRAIEHEIAALAREKMASRSAPSPSSCAPGLLRAQGQPGPAIARLRAAVDGFQAQRMGLYAAVAQRQLGLLLGDDDGARLRASAEAWLMARARPSATPPRSPASSPGLT